MNNIIGFTEDFFPSINTEDLLDVNKLQTILYRAGLNDEILNEQPPELAEYFGTGYGLKIWQYPNQFVSYLLFLSKYSENINSYLEIGCRYGGTFIFTNEFLNKLKFTKIKSVACDIIDYPSNLIEYTKINDNANYYCFNSHSIGFENFLEDKYFSLVLIDADHSYESVKKDTELLLDRTDIIVLHDIVSDACPGVVKYWSEFKSTYSTIFNFYEFVDQYSSVNGSFLGIGCAVKKTIDRND